MKSQKPYFKQNDNKKPFNPFDPETTKQLIDKIYENIDFNKYKYKLLEYESQLNELKNSKYYITSNYIGVSSILCFFKLTTSTGERRCSVIIERKKLLNRKQLNIEELTINSFRVKLDNSIYNGSFFDGIFINDRRTNTKTFIIQDVYKLRGYDMTTDTIKNKLLKLSMYLNQNYKPTDPENKLTLVVNTLHELNEIGHIKEIMDKTKIYATRGLTFYPEITTNMKLIFLFTNEPTHETITTTNTDIINTDIQKKLVYSFKNKTNNKIIKTLEVRKTDAPDVYYIMCCEKYIENSINKIKIIKLGIALVPDTKCSSLCRNILDSKKNNKALMKCQLDENKNRWIPIEEDKVSKLPTDIKDLNDDLVITENYE